MSADDPRVVAVAKAIYWESWQFVLETTAGDPDFRNWTLDQVWARVRGPARDLVMRQARKAIETAEMLAPRPVPAPMVDDCEADFEC